MPDFDDIIENHPGRVLLTGIAFCVALVATFALWGPLTAKTSRQRATEDATHFAHALHPSWQHPAVLCQAVDSDGNGYLSCTIGDGQVVEPIECAPSVWFDYGRGCRPVRFLTAPTSGAGQ